MIPPDHDAKFVYHMERVLDLYHEPYDPDRPVVCFDESHGSIESPYGVGFYC